VHRELVAFRAGIGAGVRCVMVSNAITPALCARPAVLCRSTYRMLRRAGFRGAIVTDSLNAGALRAYGTPAGLAVRALAAGADAAMVTGPGGTLEAIKAVDRALDRGTLKPRAIRASAARVRALRTP
jgi:beta-glucosidase-like glycosyl hydrolase